MNKVSASGARGLLTSERRTDMGKEGFATRTNNLLIRKAGIWEPRFGLEALGATSSAVTRMWYDTVNRQVIRAGTASDLLQKWDGAAWTNLDTTRKYSALQAGDRYPYLLSDDGLRLINAGNTATEIAYIPEGLDITVALVGTSNAVFPVNYACAFRVLWGRKTSNDRFFFGAPSGRYLVSNTSTTNGVSYHSVNFRIPFEITTDYFFQIYRTNGSGGASIDPGDDMYLIWEAYPTSAEITAKQVTFLDYVPFNTGGPSLYTNQREQGIDEANYPCECITSSTGAGVLSTFDGCLFANNYQPRSRLEITLLSVGTGTGVNASAINSATTTSGSDSVTVDAVPANVVIGMAIFRGGSIPSGTTITNIVGTTITMSSNATASGTWTIGGGSPVIAGDYLVIGGETFIFRNETGSGSPKITTSQTPAINIKRTAESLANAINASTLVPFYASSASGPDETPGRITLTARTDRASTYTIQAFGHPKAWYPSLETAFTIESEGDPSSIVWSKPDDNYAWPIKNRSKMPGGAKVLTHVGLRSANIIFTDQGIYRVTGTYENFSLDLLDSSSVLVSSTSNPGNGVVVVENVAYALCKKGLVAVTESSVQLVRSTPEQLINSVVGAGQLSVHRGDNLIFLPQSYGTFVYHVNFDLWTSFDGVYACGAYDEDLSKMVLQDGTQARRARAAQYDAASLYDESAAGTINSISGLVVTVAATPPAQLAPGDIIVQGAHKRMVTEISGLNLTMQSVTGLTAGAMTYQTGYTCEVMFAPIAAGLGLQKMLMEGNVDFDGADTAPGTMGTANNTGIPKVVTVMSKTDLDDTTRETDGVMLSPDHMGYHRFTFPQESKRCNVFSIGVKWRCCANKARLAGMDVSYDQGAERTKR